MIEAGIVCLVRVLVLILSSWAGHCTALLMVAVDACCFLLGQFGAIVICVCLWGLRCNSHAYGFDWRCNPAECQGAVLSAFL